MALLSRVSDLVSKISIQLYDKGLMHRKLSQGALFAFTKRHVMPSAVANDELIPGFVQIDCHYRASAYCPLCGQQVSHTHFKRAFVGRRRTKPCLTCACDELRCALSRALCGQHSAFAFRPHKMCSERHMQLLRYLV